MNFFLSLDSWQRGAFIASVTLNLVATVILLRAWRKYDHLFLLWIALSQFLWLGANFGARAIQVIHSMGRASSPLYVVTSAMGLAGACFLFYGIILLAGFLKSLQASAQGQGASKNNPDPQERADSGYLPE